MPQLYHIALIVAAFRVCSAQKACKQPAAAGCVEPFLVNTHNNEDPWDAWKAKFAKTYTSVSEETHRHEVWLNNTKFMMRVNSENDMYSLGWNAKSDWTMEELSFYREGGRDMDNISLTETLGSSYKGEYRYAGKLSDLPSALDWSAASIEVVTYVKDQKCGDCWSFSAAGALEGALAVGNGWTKSLSSQQFVDCSSAGSCDGGDKVGAMKWAADHYSCSWDSYVETGHDGKCNTGCDQVITPGSIWGTYRVNPYDEGSLLSALLQRPIAISVATGDDFHHYRSGILSAAYPSKTSHAILAVGWGHFNGQAYWKVKNSWGTSWGLDGYALLYRGGGSDQNLILSKPYGVLVYGPYNPSMDLIDAQGVRISAPQGSISV